MNQRMPRRQFLHAGVVLAGSSALAGAVTRVARFASPKGGVRISLAGWSLHRRHRERAMGLLDFPRVAREEFDIEAIELVNTLFPSPHYSFLQSLCKEAERHRVKILLTMVDREGDLSSADREHRLQAVRNHHKWVDITRVLGGHAIRVNSGGRPKNVEDIDRCADSLARLGDYAAEQGLDVIVENHGGISSHPDSLLEVLRKAGRDNLGTLPDFGNFPEGTDRYEAIRAMMPHARAVSAKCYDFDQDGNETSIDFRRMMRIVEQAGYRGYVGIEYEGNRLPERDGILAAKRLLESIAVASPATK